MANEDKRKSRIISIDDIDRKNKINQREQFRDDISEDVSYVINKVTGGDKEKQKKSFFKRFLMILGIIILIIILINVILGNIWLLKFFIKELFGVSW
ncbi:hypothetical protein J4466_05455 [Candidatus Pacearchaeota archaeon]|nr:hypothetical protein [Candidatus Pacearchaeota archaeon]